ncbi:MAG: WD40/YVTN/BNR-like repeat-containing protein [Opitutaceae bacterium]
MLLRAPLAAQLAACLLPVAGAAGEAVVPRGLLLDGAVSGSRAILVGERGSIWLSSAPGTGWRRAESPTRTTLTGVALAPPTGDGAPGIGWAVGHDALVLGTRDGGVTWSRQYQGEDLQDSFLDVLALDARRAIAVGAYGIYLSTADGGATWERRQVREGDAHFNRITRSAAGTLFLAGESGTLLRSRDEGLNWTPLRAPYEGSFHGVLPLDRRTLIAHGLRGHLYRSVDEGDTWQEITPPVVGLLATGLRLRSNLILIGGPPRALALSRDYGRTFSLIPGAPATAVAELLELPDGGILALGEAGATPVILP